MGCPKNENAETFFYDFLSKQTFPDTVIQRVKSDYENERINVVIKLGEQDYLRLRMDIQKDYLNILSMQNLRTLPIIRQTTATTEHVHFISGRKNTPPLPPSLLERITELHHVNPNGKRSDEENKRISSWGKFISVQQEKLQSREAEVGYKRIDVSSDMTTVTFHLSAEPEEAGSLRRLDVTISEMGRNGRVGKVKRYNARGKKLIVELDERVENDVREHQWDAPKSGTLKIDDIGSKSQLKRLSKGVEKIATGEIVNPAFSDIFFDENPQHYIAPANQTFNLTQSIQANLNEFQRHAVNGAINADDIYLIQGPPGTGKTTVIAEICYQNAKMGLRTLIASETHLAVDNALDKLKTNEDVRILRRGHLKSVQAEGARYTEEHVA
ncbi:MAG: AAA domain-containing protein, partial [Bacilli bacterium]